MHALASERSAKRDELLSSIQEAEKRLAEIATLKKWFADRIAFLDSNWK